MFRDLYFHFKRIFDFQINICDKLSLQEPLKEYAAIWPKNATQWLCLLGKCSFAMEVFMGIQLSVETLLKKYGENIYCFRSHPYFSLKSFIYRRNILK